MKKFNTTLGFILATGIVFYSGFYIGNQQSVFAGVSYPSEHQSIDDKDFSLYWKALSILESRHPDAQDVSSKERVWSSIAGLTASYNDPYTSFFTPKETEAFEESINGEFSGVGMEVSMKDGLLTVVAPLKNSPAERAGILPGDIIVQIDKHNALELTLDQAVEKIRGPQGTDVVLLVAREGEIDTIPVTVTRDIIELTAIETRELAEDIFVIDVYSFSEDINTKFKEAMEEFYESDSKRKLIIDLRNNPGGYLSSAVDIASWFLPEGATITVESFSEESGKQDIAYRSKGYGRRSHEMDVVILVNKGSASASEIVAGALSEHGVAKLVGTNTFGKGSVQEFIMLDNEAALKVTVAKWLTPKGNSISESGLTPDIVVEYAPAQEGEVYDAQMQKAVELLMQ